MAERLGRLVGLAALALVLFRLGRVLEVAVDIPDWRLIAPAAALGGVLVTWSVTRLTPWRRLAIHAVGILLVVLRVVAPHTLLLGFLPGPATLPALGQEIGYAVEILRFGAPPVLAVAGLAALVAAATWCLGATWAWSASGGPTWAGIVPALGFYLYLAVVDRAPATTTWNLALAGLAAIALVVTGDVVPSGAGRLRAGDHRPLPRWRAGPAVGTAAMVAAIALVGSAILGSVMPAGGAVDWRNPGGEGAGLGEGGFSASRFAGLRQSIVSLSNEPVFVAAVSPAAAGGPAGYWRLLTLDRYDGEQWRTGSADFTPLENAETVLLGGETQRIEQVVEIRSLRDDRLPSFATPVSIASEESVVRSGSFLGGDGALRFNALTFDGLTYRVESEVPVVDLGALASQDGELTPMFAEAAARGEFEAVPAAARDVARPDSIGAFLLLPDGLDLTVGSIARGAIRGATTSFEAALLLEDFFRDFTYSTDVSTGHSSLDLAAWLDDPDSPNYRTGYCEQFAAAMAVMGRVLGIPSRVVIGFTGGEIQETASGPLTVVRERNAHAWVEMWIDGHGWMGFDPTPRGDVATTPLASTVGFDPGSVDLPVAEGDLGVDPQAQPGFGDIPPGLPVEDLVGAGTGSRGGGAGTWLAVGAVVVAGLSAVPMWKLARSRARRRRAAQGDITAVWDEIVDRLEDLGSGPPRHMTPIEFAAAMEPSLVPLARAYSAAVYGERRSTDATIHLRRAETWLEERFDRSARTRAILNSRSLRTRARPGRSG